MQKIETIARATNKFLNFKLEQEIIHLIKQCQILSSTQFIDLVEILNEKLLEFITSHPLGCSSPQLREVIEQIYLTDPKFKWDTLEVCKIWIKIENYFMEKSAAAKNSIFNDIKTSLKNIKKQHKNNIIYLEGAKILDKNFIKLVYLSNDPELIKLFMQQLPILPINMFDPGNIPSCIKEIVQEKGQILSTFTARNSNDASLEKKIIYLQRRIRSNLRQENEISRITNKYLNGTSFESAEEIIYDANKPYYPRKCSFCLSSRIVEASKQVKLFSSVSHYTSTSNIKTILDDCLYGRENLVKQYQTYRPAALNIQDINDGDQNVICFGYDLIDPDCNTDRTIRLKLSLDKLLVATNYNNNPCIFFKQRDFGYNPDITQSINLGDLTLYFNHTRALYTSAYRIFLETRLGTQFPKNNLYINLQLYPDSKATTPLFFAQLEKCRFISYNVAQMHQILTLNFFRFLDNLQDSEICNSASDKIKEIYNEINKLTDEEMVTFLTELGQKMSYSSEFNFYGAYKIDLEALTGIELYNDKNNIFSIEITQLCEQLNSGNLEMLNHLATLAPELFDSERFIQHLISKLGNQNAIEVIRNLPTGDSKKPTRLKF